MIEVIKKQMNFPVPDSFRDLSKEELSNFKSIGQGPEWGIQNDEKHIMIVVTSKSVGFLANYTNVTQ